MSTVPLASLSCSIRVGRSCASNLRDDVVLAVEIAILALLRLHARRVDDEHVGRAVAVLVGARARALPARVFGGQLEPPVLILIGLLAHERAVLVQLDQIGLGVGVGVDLLAQRLLLRVEVHEHVGLAVAVGVALLPLLHAAGERDGRVERAVAVGVALLRDRRAVLEHGDDVGLAVAVAVLLLARLLAARIARGEVERPVAVGVGLVALDVALRVEAAAQVHLLVAVRVLLEALGETLGEEHGAVGHAVAVAVLLGLRRPALGVAGAPEVRLAVARAVAA